MPLVKRFEDLQAWQEARRLTRQMYELCAAGPLARDFGLRDQPCRAAVSTMANGAEGFDCESRLEFARFLGFARRRPSKFSLCSTSPWTITTSTALPSTTTMLRRPKPRRSSAD